MNLIKKLLTIASLFILVSNSSAQTKTGNLPNFIPIPGNIKLLEGYTHKKLQGIDSDVGIFSKKDGLEIRYDIGLMAGNYTESFFNRTPSEIVWSKMQIVNNLQLKIVYLKNGKLYASFTEKSANFWAVVKDSEQLAEFLLIITTYNPKNS